MAKSNNTLTKVLGIAGLVWAGYMFVISLQDIKRYIRISTM